MAATVFDFYSDEPIRVPLKYRYYHMVNSRSDQSHGQKMTVSQIVSPFDRVFLVSSNLGYLKPIN